jgi:hypothetical protein
MIKIKLRIMSNIVMSDSAEKEMHHIVSAFSVANRVHIVFFPRVHNMLIILFPLCVRR